ncbi:hypothetical protein WG66_006684 [Moniliophthora roreri]|uniref:Uncharacterized protein n=1 Tax=Moniliophthora roreri TaxID=221103 RepID=A0A0W0FQ15_MONRR|nr:hypothetical protein WG66_006684 [Moniliophthora roreri]
MASEARSVPLYSCPGCGFKIGETTSNPNFISESYLLDALSISNDPLPPLQLNAVRQQYEDIVSLVASLDTQIAGLYASLETMNSERQRLKARLRKYRTVLHPIRRLPNELITRIFRLCDDTDISDPRVIKDCDTEHSLEYPGSLDTKQAPWVFTQVCRKWRNIALSVPRLWNRVDLRWCYSERVREYHPALEPLLALQLQCCSNQPLSVSYYGQAMVYNRRSKYSDNERLLMLLCSRSLQWSTAYLGFGDTGGLRPFVSYGGLFPALKSLHIDLPIHYPQIPFQVFQVAPRLRELTITGDHAGITADSFPWSQITNYLSQGSSMDGVWMLNNSAHFRIMPLLKNVQICDLECLEEPDEVIVIPVQGLTLSHLHTLTLRSRGAAFSPVSQMLNWLTLPALHTLKFPCGLQSFPELVAFLSRSSCQLRELSLVDIELDDNQIWQLLSLSNVQSLHTLTIGLYDDGAQQSLSIDDSFLWGLSFAAGREPVLPRLISLTLHGRKRWTDATLFQMSSSRRGRSTGEVARLQRLTVVGALSGPNRNPIECPDCVSRMWDLCQGGFVFEWAKSLDSILR